MSTYYLGTWFPSIFQEERIEGFTQNSPFVWKKESEVYDDFYAEIYDRLFLPSTRIPNIIHVFEKTLPSINSTNILDIGSGTGTLVNELYNKKYRVFGVDTSEAMIRYSEKNHPGIQIQLGNVMDSMLFDSSSFTHLFCTDFTIYSFEDKTRFLKNVYNWLVPNGFFIIHLVEPSSFDMIIPAGKITLIDNPQKYIDTRVLETSIVFPEFTYDAKYNISHNSNNLILFEERMIDNVTKKIRQNERTLFMDSIENIGKIMKNIRFNQINEFQTGDIYVFQR
jgi:SAM-dependent methyltransferase